MGKQESLRHDRGLSFSGARERTDTRTLSRQHLNGYVQNELEHITIESLQT